MGTAGTRVEMQTVDDGATSQNSGISRPTIGSTTISSGEAARIQYEVRSELRKMFPGIAQFEADSTPLNRGVESDQPETAAVTAVNVSGQSRHSRPEAIAGSEVSVASTHPNNGVEESQNSFTRLTNTGAGKSAQTFANV